MSRKTKNIIIGVMVILTLALGLTGCGKSEPQKETTDSKTESTAENRSSVSESLEETSSSLTESLEGVSSSVSGSLEETYDGDAAPREETYDGDAAPHEETYDRMTDQVWIATNSDGHGYIIEFWPDGVCYIIRTYGENWTGAAKRSYTIAEQTRQPLIGTGEFITLLSNDEQTMNVTMPDGESWNFHLSDHTRSAIDQYLNTYEEIFKDMNGSQDSRGSDTAQTNTSAPAADQPSTPAADQGAPRNDQPNANGKYEYSINKGNFTFETDINVWDYIDNSNNFDIVRMMNDWGIDSVDISLQKEMGTAESKNRNIGIIFNLDDSYNLNSYQLRPAVYWMFVNKSFTVHIGPNIGSDAMYTVKDYSPWGMSLDEIELFAYFVQYGASNKSDQYYMEDFGYNWKTNDYWLP